MINGCSILNGAKYFVENESSNYLVFQLVFRYFQIPANNNMVMVLKFKSLSDEVIKPLATSDNSPNPRMDYFNNPDFQVEFTGLCLKLDKLTFAPIKQKLYLTFKTKPWSYYIENGFML